MTELAATTHDEDVVFIPSGAVSLCTIITRPVSASNGIGIVLLHPLPGTNGSFSKARLWVRAARRLAAHGFTVARFDARGVGDSTGTANQFSLESPFLDDVERVYDHLEGLGLHSVGVAGHCAGARVALAQAARSPKTAAAVLVQMPLRDHAMGERDRAFVERFAERADLRTFVRRGLRWGVLRGLASPRQRKRYRQAVGARLRSRLPGPGRRHGHTGPRVVAPSVSSEVRDGLTALADRQVPVLLIFGERDLEYRDARELQLATVVRDRTVNGLAPEVRTLPADQDLWGLPTTKSRDSVVGCLTEWLIERLPSRGS